MTYDQIKKVWRRSRRYDRHSPVTWYYKGSDDSRHYFARGKHHRTYKVEKSHIVVKGAFPLTQVRSEWRQSHGDLGSIRLVGDDRFPKTLDFTEKRRPIEADATIDDEILNLIIQ